MGRFFTTILFLFCISAFANELCEQAIAALHSARAENGDAGKAVAMQAILYGGQLRKENPSNQSPSALQLTTTGKNYQLVAPMDPQVWWAITPPSGTITPWSLLLPSERVTLMTYLMNESFRNADRFPVARWFAEKQQLSQGLLGTSLDDAVNGKKNGNYFLKGLRETAIGEVVELAVRSPLSLLRDNYSGKRHLNHLKKTLATKQAEKAVQETTPKGLNPAMFIYNNSQNPVGCGVCTERSTAATLLAVDLGAPLTEVGMGHGMFFLPIGTHSWSTVKGHKSRTYRPKSGSLMFPWFRRTVEPSLFEPRIIVDPNGAQIVK